MMVIAGLGRVDGCGEIGSDTGGGEDVIEPTRGTIRVVSAGKVDGAGGDGTPGTVGAVPGFFVRRGAGLGRVGAGVMTRGAFPPGVSLLSKWGRRMTAVAAAAVAVVVIAAARPGFRRIAAVVAVAARGITAMTWNRRRRRWASSSASVFSRFSILILMLFSKSSAQASSRFRSSSSSGIRHPL
ncbi:hypothetical protein [Actinoallomurus vinaceus]|uniref:hypothetical protein n=1 Tax=Actinoallomurus vinaceus TaxID=1080074 RepID=UPI0031E6C404